MMLVKRSPIDTMPITPCFWIALRHDAPVRGMSSLSAAEPISMRLASQPYLQRLMTVSRTKPGTRDEFLPAAIETIAHLDIVQYRTDFNLAEVFVRWDTIHSAEVCHDPTQDDCRDDRCGVCWDHGLAAATRTVHRARPNVRIPTKADTCSD